MVYCIGTRVVGNRINNWHSVGNPPGVGTFVVEIQLADVIPRTDTESFNLKINPAETPYTPPTEETVSFEDLHLGDLWIVLACVSIVVGLSRIITRGARI